MERDIYGGLHISLRHFIEFCASTSVVHLVGSGSSGSVVVVVVASLVATSSSVVIVIMSVLVYSSGCEVFAKPMIFNMEIIGHNISRNNHEYLRDPTPSQGWGTVYCVDQYIAIYCSLKRILRYYNILTIYCSYYLLHALISSGIFSLHFLH